MGKLRRVESQGPIEKDLPRRRGDEIVAANHLRYTLLCIIRNDRKLIGRRSRRLPDHEVAAVLPQVHFNLSLEAVLEDVSPVLDAKSPTKRRRQLVGIDHLATSTGSRIDADRAGPIIVGSTGRAL